MHFQHINRVLRKKSDHTSIGNMLFVIELSLCKKILEIASLQAIQSSLNRCAGKHVFECGKNI